MIVLKDNRGLCPYHERRVIGAIDVVPFGSDFVQITDEWYDAPVLPLGIRPQGVFPQELFRTPDAVRCWIEETAELLGMTGPLYISMFPGNIAAMDIKYKTPTWAQTKEP